MDAQQTPQAMLTLQRRLKLLEESLANLRKQEVLNEQNTIELRRKTQTQLRDFNHSIDKFHEDLEVMKNDIRTIIAELRSCAKSEDVTSLKKYVEMINPVHFVTQKEIEILVAEEVAKHRD